MSELDSYLNNSFLNEKSKEKIDNFFIIKNLIYLIFIIGFIIVLYLSVTGIMYDKKYKDNLHLINFIKSSIIKEQSFYDNNPTLNKIGIIGIT